MISALYNGIAPSGPVLFSVCPHNKLLAMGADMWARSRTRLCVSIDTLMVRPHLLLTAFDWQ